MKEYSMINRVFWYHIQLVSQPSSTHVFPGVDALPQCAGRSVQVDREVRGQQLAQSVLTLLVVVTRNCEKNCNKY